MSDEKLGVYICHCGGNISDYVDTVQVADIINMEKEVAIAKDFIFMCSDAGQNMITEDIKENNLTHVIVASCSPRLHHMTFQKLVAEAGINPYTYRHVNIREQVSWVHSHDGDLATEKAIRLIRGAIASVIRLKELVAFQKAMIPVAAVIGGGVAGMTAALDIARQGIPVHLIEKNNVLGGQLLNLDKLYPNELDSNTFILDLIKKTMANENIILHLNTEVMENSGTIGDFKLKLNTRNETQDSTKIQLDMVQDKGEEIDNIRVGTITIATGFDTYTPYEGEFAFGMSEFVLTLPDMIKHLNTNPSGKFIYKGKEIKKVAMIHCVGSRQSEDNDDRPEGWVFNQGCSRVCCTATLQQANRIKQNYPEIEVYDFYRDIRTYGEKEVYYKNASQNNVIFMKYPDDVPPKVIVSDNLLIQSIDELTYGLELEVEVDLIVLAVGMIPHQKPQFIEQLSLATGINGFLQEAHVKLQPVESSVDGIFYAGTAQGPKDVKESTMSASATSAKAVTLLTKETVELSPKVADVNVEACSGTGECIAECEYNAISMIEVEDEQKAKITPELCVSCGACVPVCKNRAITIAGYNTDTILAEVKAMIREVEL